MSLDLEDVTAAIGKAMSELDEDRARKASEVKTATPKISSPKSEGAKISDRFMVRLPETFQNFLLFEHQETGLKYADIIRQALMQSKGWADWKKHLATEAKSEAKAATAEAKRNQPKPKTQAEIRREAKAREKLMDDLLLYKGSDGFHVVDPDDKQKHTWHSYLNSIRYDAYGAIRDPEAHDIEAEQVMQRIERIYSAAGVEPPRFNPHYMLPRCVHDVRQGVRCVECEYDQDREAGLV